MAYPNCQTKPTGPGPTTWQEPSLLFITFTNAPSEVLSLLVLDTKSGTDAGALGRMVA